MVYYLKSLRYVLFLILCLAFHYSTPATAAGLWEKAFDKEVEKLFGPLNNLIADLEATSEIFAVQKKQNLSEIYDILFIANAACDSFIEQLNNDKNYLEKFFKYKELSKDKLRVIALRIQSLFEQLSLFDGEFKLVELSSSTNQELIKNIQDVMRKLQNHQIELIKILSPGEKIEEEPTAKVIVFPDTEGDEYLAQLVNMKEQFGSTNFQGRPLAPQVIQEESANTIIEESVILPKENTFKIDEKDAPQRGFLNAEQRTNLGDLAALPNELLENILLCLDPESLFNLTRSCKYIYNLHFKSSDLCALTSLLITAKKRQITLPKDMLACELFFEEVYRNLQEKHFTKLNDTYAISSFKDGLRIWHKNNKSYECINTIPLTMNISRREFIQYIDKLSDKHFMPIINNRPSNPLFKLENNELKEIKNYGLDKIHLGGNRYFVTMFGHGPKTKFGLGLRIYELANDGAFAKIQDIILDRNLFSIVPISSDKFLNFSAHHPNTPIQIYSWNRDSYILSHTIDYGEPIESIHRIDDDTFICVSSNVMKVYQLDAENGLFSCIKDINNTEILPRINIKEISYSHNKSLCIKVKNGKYDYPYFPMYRAMFSPQDILRIISVDRKTSLSPDDKSIRSFAIDDASRGVAADDYHSAGFFWAPLLDFPNELASM